MADLQQHADPVAHLPGGILSGPMLQPLYNGQGIGNNFMAGNAVDADNGADAAGIVFKFGGIQCMFHDGLRFLRFLQVLSAYRTPNRMSP